MSIAQIVRQSLGNRLFVLEPMIKSDRVSRVMIVSEEILQAVEPPFADHYDGIRLADFRQTLDAFTTGEQITVAENPFKKPSDAFMARVSPVELEVFDFRSLAGPGIRAFGCFIEKNQFAALTWDYRENIDDFEFECQRCRSELRQICGSVEPFSIGKQLHDCLKDFVPV